MPNASFDKRQNLFSKITLFATGVALFHTIQDLLYGSSIAPLMDFCVSLFMFVCYVLNKKRHHKAAKFLGVSFLNLFFTAYACLVPKEVGMYLFFFPLIAISSAIFDDTEKRARMFFIGLSVTLLIALFLSDFDLIGSYSIEATHVETFFMINLVSSSVVLVGCINFIIRVNENSEEKLRKLAKEIEIKNANLEKTNSELDRFLYSTTHDLRAPLLSIRGLVSIAEIENKDERIKTYLSMMANRADKLDNFIKDIIDYSRNKRTEVNVESVNISHLLDEVMENFEFLDGAQKIRFEKQVHVNSAIKMDKSRISVVLNNLISNSIKYHNYYLEDPWIKVDVKSSDGLIKIIIADNGQGITSDHQQKIFDMFYRATDKSKGSGLGLYIVKEIVDKMDGHITVESTVDKGTTFFIDLPLTSNGIAKSS